MEDERIVPFLVSVCKAEVWRHLGFCGYVRTGTAARAPPCFRCLAGGRSAAAAFSRVEGVLCRAHRARVVIACGT